MPTFFNQNDLTDSQKALWDYAIAEYERVQESNLDWQLADMSDEEQAAALASFRENNPECTKSLRDHYKLFRGFMGGRAGDCKSALFARLLDGKPALPYPPPTSYSYPWYGIIEDKGPFHVMLGGVPTLGGQMRGTGGAQGNFSIGINQCAWAVVSHNKAAEDLMALQDQLSATAKPEKEGSFHYRYTWTPALLEGVLAAYAAAPEFIVQFGKWPEYRLFLGRLSRPCRRGYANSSIQKIEHAKVENLSNIGSVFDTHSFFLNAVFGEAISKSKHPRVALEEREAQKATSQYPKLDALFHEKDVANLEKDIAEYEADPGKNDMVDVAMDDWMLEKTSTPTWPDQHHA